MGICPVGHASNIAHEDVTEQYEKCPISFYYDGALLGNCRKCGQAHDSHPQSWVGCDNGWTICKKCFNKCNCVLDQPRSPEVPEAKVGEIKWVVVR